MDSSCRGYFIEKGCCYFMFVIAGGSFCSSRKRVKTSAFGKHACYGVDYPFATSQRDKPMMNYRYSHILEANSMLASARC